MASRHGPHYVLSKARRKRQTGQWRTIDIGQMNTRTVVLGRSAKGGCMESWGVDHGPRLMQSGTERDTIKRGMHYNRQPDDGWKNHMQREQSVETGVGTWWLGVRGPGRQETTQRTV